MSYLQDLRKFGWDLSELSTNERIEDILYEVRRLPIADVLSNYGVKPVKASNSRILALCPFHLDEHVGSFSISTVKNSCFCYSCNKGGDAIKSMSIIWNKTYIEAALQIATDNSIISKEEYKELSGCEYSDEYLDKQAKKIENHMLIKKQRPEEKTLDMWTDIYEFLRDYFKLSDKDYKYLKEVRHLPDDRIRKDYFSFCINDQKEASRIIFELKKTFPQYTDKLSEVPGFFEVKDKKSDRYLISMLMTDSIGILLRNASGKVVAIQQRNRNINSNCKYSYYSWKTSNTGNLRKGNTVGTPIDVCFPEMQSNKPKIAIVEGRFKSEILAQNGFTSLSVQGVNNFSGIEKDLSDLETIFNKPIENLFVFYDADLLRNENVYKAAIKLGNYINNVAPGITVKYVIWPPENGKGIDDLIFAEKKDTCKVYDKDFFINAYDRNYSATIAKTGIDMRNISKLTKEERTQFFDVFEKLNRKEFNI